MHTCRYNFLLNDRGTVIDDLVVYRLKEEEYYIVVNAATKDGDVEHIRKNLSDDVIFTDESESTVKLDIQGPESAAVISGLGTDVSDLRYFNSKQTEISSIPCLLSRTGYTGELGYEIYVAAEFGEKLWDLILACDDVSPAGLGARDTLRLEMGYALYGHELNLDTTPIEAGYEGMLHVSDEREFIGRDALINNPPAKKLTALLLKGRRAAREGSRVMLDGKDIGYVTSGVFSPSLKCAIAAAYISSEYKLEKGDEIELNVKGKILEAVIDEFPFYKNGTARQQI